MVEHGVRILTWLRGRQEIPDAHVLAWQKISGRAVHDAHVSAWLSEQEEISKQEMSLYAEAWPLGLELDEVNLDIEKWSQEKVKNKDISKDSALQEKIEDLKVQKNKLDWRLDPENLGKRKFLPVPEKLKIQPQVDNYGSAQTGSVMPAITASESASVESLPPGEPDGNAATSPVFFMARGALVSKYRHDWETIERDLKDAASNGLSAAKAGPRDWKEDVALDWARAKGKLKSAINQSRPLDRVMHSMNSLSGQKHTLKG